MVDRIAEPWGARTPYGVGRRWPDRVDSRLTDGLSEHDVDHWVQSAAVRHSNGDGIDIRSRTVALSACGDARLTGSTTAESTRKISTGWQANNLPDRLTVPLVRDGDALVETDWDTAMERIIAATRALLRDCVVSPTMRPKRFSGG